MAKGSEKGRKDDDDKIGRRRLFTKAQMRSFNLFSQGELCKKSKSAERLSFSCKHSLRVLVVPQNFPSPTLHGSDKRCFHVMEALRAVDHRVAMVPFMKTFVKPGDDDNELLKAIKVQYYEKNLVAYKRNTTDNYRHVLDDFKPDVIITWLWFWEMRQTAPSVILPLTRAMRPEAKVVVFTDDVHYKRERQIAEQFKNFHAFDHYIRRSKKMKLIEENVYIASDLVVAITQADRADIATLEGVLPSKVFVMRYVASPWEDAAKARSVVPGFASRKDIVFVGNGENPTNIHAMKWYLESLAEEIAKGIPGVRLKVIGNAWDTFIEGQPTSTKYMDFLGPLSTEDMNTAIDSALVFVAPIRASTGINTKNVLALNRGIPLVTTPAGAVGMCARCDNAILVNPIDPFGVEPDKNAPLDMPLLMGRDTFDFIDQVKLLYNDQALWMKYSKAGADHIKSWFGSEQAVQDIDDILKALYKESK